MLLLRHFFAVLIGCGALKIVVMSLIFVTGTDRDVGDASVLIEVLDLVIRKLTLAGSDLSLWQIISLLKGMLILLLIRARNKALRADRFFQPYCFQI